MNATQLLEHFDRLTETPDAMPRLRRLVLELAVRGKLVGQDSTDEPVTAQLKDIHAARAIRIGNSTPRARNVSVQSKSNVLQFALPSGWSVVSLAELTDVLNGRAYAKNELLDAGTPVLRVGNLFTSKNWYYSNLTLEEDKYCDEGDLIFSWSASFGPFIWPGPKVIYHYHIWKLRLYSETRLDKHYLYRFLLQQTQKIKESGHGVSMIHMTKEKMERLLVPLPPLAEQRRIVAKIDELMALCDQLEAQLTTIQTDRRRLLEAVLEAALVPA
jgi:type I restriction enzyme, S subunit